MNQSSLIASILILANSAQLNILCQACLDGETVICLEEQWNGQPSFTWPATCQSSDELIVSSPLRCLDRYKHYVTRTCSATSGWLPPIGEIECPYDIDENTILNTCPPNFAAAALSLGILNDVQICVYIVPKGNSLELFCLQTGSSLTLDEIDADTSLRLLEHVVDEHGSQFYLPASKLWYNRLTEMQVVDYSFQWQVVGKYGKSLNLSLVPETNADDCIYTDLSILNHEYFFTQDCNLRFPQICLYDQQQPAMLQLFCPDGYKTTRYRSQYYHCYKIQKFETAIQRDELTDDYVRDHICSSDYPFWTNEMLSVFRVLSRDEHLKESDRCLFMNSLNGKVIITEEEWTLKDMDQFHFVNWSLNVTLSEEDSPAFKRNILVARNNGEWMWDGGVITCAFCNFVQGASPGIQLKLEMTADADGNLVAAVQNENWGWKEVDSISGISCFSYTLESKHVEDVRLIPMVGENSSIKRYTLLTSGTGRYWCSGLNIRSNYPVEADFEYKVPIKFALSVQPQLSSQTSDQFHSFLDELLDHARFQIMKMSLQSSSSSINLYHVTVIAVTDDFLKFEENKIGLDEPMLIAFYIQRHLNEIRLLTNPQTDFFILSLNSTEFCLPPSISQLDEFNWPGARIGQFVHSCEFCLLATNGLPVTKRCIGNGRFGGVWMESSDKIKCNSTTQSPITSQLHNLSLLHIPSIEITNIIDQLECILFELDYADIIAADIFYVGRIMLSIQYNVAIYPLQRDYVSKILRLYNRLLRVDQDVMYETSSLNTTNVLLDAVDVIVANFAVSEMSRSNDAFASFQFDEALLSTFIFNPKYTNFTGIIATNRTSQLTVEYVNKFQKIEDIINVPDLILASYVPAPLLERLQNSFIIVSLFVNNILFHSYNPSDSEESLHRSNRQVVSGSSILSIAIPGTDGRLPKLDTLPIFIKPDQSKNFRINDDNVCGFWSFSPAINGWDIHGCQSNKKLTTVDVVLCECDHLTHFAYLMYGNTPVDFKHFEKLGTVTFIACSISLAGLFGVFLSALLFRSWRSTMSTKYLLQMSTALTLELAMVLFVSTENNSRRWIEEINSPMCIAIGALLHYSVLVTWMWMFVIGYMQYMRYVVVFHSIDSTKVFLVSSLIGWGIPTIPVAAVLLINSQSYVPAAVDYEICYLSGNALYFALMTPIAIIIAANFIIFVLVIKSLRNSGTGVGLKQETKATILSKLRLSIFLFFVLGLTWTFSFLSTTNAGVVFTYLFCTTATLQGFVFFFYFIVLDPTVRGLWVAVCIKRT